MYGNKATTVTSLLDTVVSEGLATVFEWEMSGVQPPWGKYPAEVEKWVEELLRLPPNALYEEWMYNHPDGRRWIGYKAGTYIVKKAKRNSGLKAAEMVTLTTREVLEMADIDVKAT